MNPNTDLTQESESLFVSGGYRWQVRAPFRCQTDIIPDAAIDTEFVSLDTNGMLTLKPGYAFDGVTGAPDIPQLLPAAAVHDGLYQLMRGGYLDRNRWRERADSLLRRRGIQDGTAHAFAELAYQAVHLVGDPAADPSIEHPICQFPRDA